MPGDPIPIPEHESPLRRLIADSRGEAFHPLRSLDEARAFADGVVILEGDYGGQIYLTCPVDMVHCSPEALQELLRTIDAKCWACNDGDGAAIYYERKPAGSGVWGGMGGGVVTAGLWLHEKVERLGMRPQIEAVLAGRQDRPIRGA